MYHVYPKYRQHYKKDHSQWTQRLYIYDNFYIQIGFTKENSYYSLKLQEKSKKSDPNNTKEYY